MPRPINPCVVLFAVLLLAGGPGSLLARADDTPVIGAFVYGQEGPAARIAEDIERSLRGFIYTTGLYQNVKLDKILDRGSSSKREAAVEEARSLLARGKSDYEQLDLEKAQAKFHKAQKLLEYGYGYLRDQSLFLECTLHLGATWVLVGEPEKASRVFMRAHGLPGPKVLDPNLFPPNIQDIFNQAMQKAENAPKGSVRLITTPPRARLYIDGSYRGVSPLTVENLRAGHHMVRAIKDGYRPWGGKIKVSATRTRSLKLNLKPTSGFNTFQQKFRAMQNESQQGRPGPAARDLAGSIGASYLALVVAQGQPDTLTLRGYHCELSGGFKLASHQEVLDTTDDSFPEMLSGYFGALLATTPKEPGQSAVAAAPSPESAEGEAAAAALLADSESGDEQEEDPYGLDLGTDSGSGEETSGQEVASAAPPEEKDGEKTPREEALDESLRDAGKEEPEDHRDSPSTWGYLSTRWWFWTAVGVVVAGAATGTYFLATSGEEAGGRLILGLH